jgi:L-rhamnose mutarotase
MRRITMALDLVDDPNLIAEYEAYHAEVWPEIQASIRDAGVTHMEIYRFGNRLFMLMDVDDTFTFERKAEMDAANTKVQEWEALMWKFQQAVPGAKPGQKWVMMNKIFELY